jgi:hypothetical protein
MVDGRAKLLRERLLRRTGRLSAHLPTGAITFVEREAAPYDEAAVQAKKAAGDTLPAAAPAP